MSRKITALFCLILLAILVIDRAIANDNQTSHPAVTQQSTQKDAGGEQGFSTDLGKGLPYKGLTPEESEKLNGLPKQEGQISQSKVEKTKINQTKPVTDSNLNQAVSDQPAISQQEKTEVKTDLSNGKPYPGLSSQEQEKLQSTGGK
jgi:hypothetical protein